MLKVCKKETDGGRVQAKPGGRAGGGDVHHYERHGAWEDALGGKPESRDGPSLPARGTPDLGRIYGDPGRQRVC